MWDHLSLIPAPLLRYAILLGLGRWGALKTNRLNSCGTICPSSLKNQQTKFMWGHLSLIPAPLLRYALLVGLGRGDGGWGGGKGGGHLQLLFCFTHLLGKLTAIHWHCSQQQHDSHLAADNQILRGLMVWKTLVFYYYYWLLLHSIVLCSQADSLHSLLSLPSQKFVSSFRSSVTFDSCFSHLRRLPFYSAEEVTDTLCLLLHIIQWWAMTFGDLVTSQCKAQLTGVSVVAR